METVVIDANFGVSLLHPLPYSKTCRGLMEQWIKSGVGIIVPALWDYEVISALRKLWTQHLLSKEAALRGLEHIFRLPLQRIPADHEMSISALLWSERLGQMVVYDAQYLSLAELLESQFYTSDRKLFNRCREIKVGFIHLLE